MLLIIAAATIPLALVSVAFACGRLATLYLTPGSARAGKHVTGFGRNYNTAPNASPVQLHFRTRSGRVLWTGRPDLNGTITPRFRIPHVRAGTYVVLAEQTTPTGAPSPGTPGRAVLHIGKRRRRGAVAVWPSHNARSSRPGAGSALVAPDAGIIAGLLSGGLLAAGVLVLVADRRRQHAPRVA